MSSQLQQSKFKLNDWVFAKIKNFHHMPGQIVQENARDFTVSFVGAIIDEAKVKSEDLLEFDVSKIGEHLSERQLKSVLFQNALAEAQKLRQKWMKNKAKMEKAENQAVVVERPLRSTRTRELPAVVAKNTNRAVKIKSKKEEASSPVTVVVNSKPKPPVVTFAKPLEVSNSKPKPPVATNSKSPASASKLNPIKCKLLSAQFSLVSNIITVQQNLRSDEVNLDVVLKSLDEIVKKSADFTKVMLLKYPFTVGAMLKLEVYVPAQTALMKLNATKQSQLKAGAAHIRSAAKLLMESISEILKIKQDDDFWKEYIKQSEAFLETAPQDAQLLFDYIPIESKY